MPDLSRFAAFASRAGVVSPACSTYSTVAPGQVLQEKSNENSAVSPVSPRNSDTLHESDLIDAFEERAAIMEYDGGMSREEAEAMAWADVFGSRARAA